MALKTAYPYDKNGRPLWLVGNTKAIFDDKGISLADLLSRISEEASKETFLFTQNGFPDIGDGKCLYCDGTDFYAWDTTNQSYKKIISETASSAMEKAHTHINKAILDAVTKAYTIEEAEKLDATTAAANSAIQNIRIGSDRIAKSGNEVVLPVYPTRKSLNVDFVDNTHDIDKPISTAAANEFRSVRGEISTESARAKEAESTLSNDIQSENTRATTEEEKINKSIQDEITRSTTAEKANTDAITAESTRATAKESALQTSIQNEITRATASENEIKNTIATNKPIWDDKYTKNEIDNKFSTLETAIDWKEAVNSFDDLTTTYPNPEDGWTVNVKDTDYTYRWNGTTWIPISANAIPKATEDVDGLLSKEDKVSYDDAYSKRHTHANKSVLDKFSETLLSNWIEAYNKRHEHGNKSIIDSITQALIDNWNLAFTHISDIVKHITATERNNWNDANAKKHEHSNKGVVDKLTQAMLDKLSGIAAGAEVNVQSDWNTTDTGADAYIKNKPTSMPASDVSAWAKAASKPSYGWEEIGSKPSTFPPSSHTHPKSQITDMPTKLSQFTNDKGFITSSDIDTSQNHTHANKSVLDKVTQTMLDKLAGIAEKANNYVHPTTSGNKHIPSGGTNGQILCWSADGTATWGTDNNTDTKNTAGSTDSSSKLFLIGATSQAANPQTYSHDTAYVGTDGCLYSGGKKTSIEGHTHNYAGASSAGGAATSANKVNNAIDINGQSYNGASAVNIDILPLVLGTQTYVTGTWAGSASSVSALYDGLSIRYWLPYSGSGNATLTLTLKDGTSTGAIACYYKGTSRLTTHYQAGSLIVLTYRKDISISGSSTKYTGWWAAANYNSDTYNRIRMQNVIKAKSTITALKIIAGDSGGYSQLAANNPFDIRYPILYAQSGISSGETGDNNYMIYNSIPLANVYSFTATEYSLIYIRGTLSGNMFTPNSTLLSVQPVTEDEYQYIQLGYAYSTSAFFLLPNHPIYHFKNGMFQEFSNSSQSAETVLRNISIPISSFSNMTANYSNASITANQIPDVIFNKASQTVAAKAGITVSTEAGKLVLTTLRLPEADLTIETLILKDAG